MGASYISTTLSNLEASKQTYWSKQKLGYALSFRLYSNISFELNSKVQICKINKFAKTHHLSNIGFYLKTENRETCDNISMSWAIIQVGLDFEISKIWKITGKETWCVKWNYDQDQKNVSWIEISNKSYDRR